jgi:hypothetical protein
MIKKLLKQSLLLLTISFCFAIISTTQLQAQDVRQELSAIYQRAQSEMKAGEYEKANASFRKILTLKTKLPAEMPYLFAETLYEIGQYENSHSFLEKYFEIMGQAGTYYENALKLEKLLDEKLATNINCQYCDVSGYRLKTCETCQGEKQIFGVCNYCNGKGNVGCQICSGDGVIIELGALGNKSYKTCHRCEGKGYHVCPVCEGEKEFYNYCPTCLGTGTTSTNIICNHKPLEN